MVLNMDTWIHGYIDTWIRGYMVSNSQTQK